MGGYYHDDQLNIRCSRCNNVLLATTEEDEQALQKLYSRPTRDAYEPHIHQTQTVISPAIHGVGGHPMHNRANGSVPRGAVMSNMMNPEDAPDYE
jgi:hypothetical protein